MQGLLHSLIKRKLLAYSLFVCFKIRQIDDMDDKKRNVEGAFKIPSMYNVTMRQGSPGYNT